MNLRSINLIVLSIYLILQSSYGDGHPNGVQESFGLKEPIPTLKLHHRGKKSYYLGNIFKGNLLKAEQFCRYHGMNLVNIESTEENDFLQKIIVETGSLGDGLEGSDDYMLTSFTRIPDGKYVSLTSGKTLTYLNWHRNQPNGGQEECIGLHREGSELQWHDVSCWSKYYFCCEVVWSNREQDLLQDLNSTLHKQIHIELNIS
ncbi:snaclec coagulation factor IX/factor X-binding protein subunit A [Diabrotica virgifera virgifera]|uniref:Snaclec coagulation factor IX/factor X-binding protein subunit A-like n=1 Tax=Diabrotica virgifera virgifera TaxID=50390 RepID=A0A6P7G158_DIAVI|nr:snaclec coagulation factor IX/factor X-binding protein subunit A [Diabrotica virgifera virgifera]